ncbi:MAG: hypothetical protein GY798_21500 [Hyphomicrobiales bacterium]|nr:hypothetical protein [Hyphomicrobiales bacterium]
MANFWHHNNLELVNGNRSDDHYSLSVLPIALLVAAALTRRLRRRKPKGGQMSLRAISAEVGQSPARTLRAPAAEEIAGHPKCIGVAGWAQTFRGIDTQRQLGCEEWSAIREESALDPPDVPC